MAALGFGATLPFTGIPAFARAAEDLGYDYLTSGDHVAFHGPQANAFVALSVAAGATERIGLLSAATLLPLYPPALAAKMAAMLDVASAGRFNLGVGVGGEYPPEFAACGVPVKQRGARTDEALVLIRRLLSEDEISFDGRFSRVEGITIQPRRPRLPPIWIAGRQEAAMRRAARFGDAWIPYMYTPEQLRSSLERINTFLPEFSRTPGAVHGSVFTFVAVDADGQRARQQAIDYVGALYQQDFSRLVDRYVVHGTPDDCCRRLQEYAEAGAHVVLTNFACPDEEKPSMLHLFGTEVIGAMVREPTRADASP